MEMRRGEGGERRRHVERQRHVRVAVVVGRGEGVKEGGHVCVGGGRGKGEGGRWKGGHDHLPQDDAEGVDLGRGAVGPARCHLGRHVPRRARLPRQRPPRAARLVGLGWEGVRGGRSTWWAARGERDRERGRADALCGWEGGGVKARGCGPRPGVEGGRGRRTIRGERGGGGTSMRQSLARPKSKRTRRPSAVKPRLSGLRSRCCWRGRQGETRGRRTAGEE